MELAFSLKHDGPEPLHKQLYAELRKGILAGRLPAGLKLPSTRELAQSLAISRTTAAQSYDQLLAEGYIETKRGSGTFVSEQIPDDLSECRPACGGGSRAAHNRPQPLSYRLSAYGLRLALEQTKQRLEDKESISFRYGLPAFEALPWKLWKRLMIKHCEPAAHVLDYSDDWQGYEPLRQAIAAYLIRSRAVNCNPDQVIILNGSQQALDLCTRLLVSPGERVVIEDPGYSSARRILQTGGAELVPVPVDQSGLVTSSLPQSSNANCKLAYVTPSHQFPTGAVMTLPRRMELLAWARQHKVLILEDDYDSEFRYTGSPIPSLQGLDDGNSVIYIGTFSKVLFPALRLAYVVVPRELVPLFAQAKWLSDRQCPILEQCVLAEFISEGHLERHIRRMRTYYDGLRKMLVRTLTRAFGENVTILGDSTGLHVMVRLSCKYSNNELLQRAGEHKVGITDARAFYHSGGGAGEFILGYGALTEKEIREGIRRLARAVK